MGKIKGFLFAVRHREILMTDLGLSYPFYLVRQTYISFLVTIRNQPFAYINEKTAISDGYHDSPWE